MKQEILTESPAPLREFLGYMQTIQGKSEKTIDEYYLDLRTFFRYIKLERGLVDKNTQFHDIQINDIDIELIRTIGLVDVFGYMNYLMSERDNNAKTRSRKSSSLRMFFKYLTKKTGQLKENPVQELDNPKLKKGLPKFLTLEQSMELLKSVEGEYRERDYCILTLFLNCGIRLSELVGINLTDIGSDRTLRITGKGNKERIIYLNDACINAIEEYKKVRPVDKLVDKKALFISRFNKRISPKTVQYIVYKYLKSIGLGEKGYSVHKLRHTAATLMYQHGHVDIRILKDILGHANLNTTEIYTHLSSEQLEQAACSNPLSKVSIGNNKN